MAMTEERARELSALEPPPSIERIVRFFTELGERINAAGVTEEQGAGPGGVGRQAASFAQNITKGGGDMGQTLAHWFTVLMDRYQVRVVDLPEFSLWLAKWYEVRSRTDSIVIRDDEAAPAWGRSPAARAALAGAALPAVQTGAVFAAPPSAGAPFATPSPADAAPPRVYARQRVPSNAQPAPDDTADGPARTPDAPRPARRESPTPRSAWQEARREGGQAAGAPQKSPKAPGDGPNQFTPEPDAPAKPSVRPFTATGASKSPGSPTAPPDALPRGLSGVVGRRLWTSNLMMGGMFTGSLLRSSQAAGADPNALIVGGSSPLAPASGLGMAGPQSIGPTWTPGSLPLATRPGADAGGGATPSGLSPGTHGFGPSPNFGPSDGHAPSPHAGPSAPPSSASATASDPGHSPAQAQGAPPPPAPAGLSAQAFAEQRAGQFPPSAPNGIAPHSANHAAHLAPAHGRRLGGMAFGAVSMGLAIPGAASVGAAVPDGARPMFGFTSATPGVPDSPTRLGSPGQQAQTTGKPPTPARPELGQAPTPTRLSAQAFAEQRTGQSQSAAPEGIAAHSANHAAHLAPAHGRLPGGTALGLAGRGLAVPGAAGSLFGFTSATPVDLLAAGGSASPQVPDSLSQQAQAAGKPPIPARPEMGQITLVAPPLRVATEQAEQGGMATAFDWTNLARGAGALDAGGLARLKQALPPGAQALYPALPPGSLGQGAVNLALAPSLLGPLLQQGYGPNAAGMADKVGGMASAAIGTPPAAPLVARIVPGKKPTGDGAGLGHDEAHRGAGPAGALGQAGQASATRGGVLDFLGMPVRLAPSLSGKPELNDEVAVRSGVQAAPGQTVRPNQFAGLRSNLFPGFGSIAAEPDKHAWEKAAPHFGLRDSRPTTLLAPDARAPRAHSPSAFAPASSPSAPPPAAGGLTPGGPMSAGLSAGPPSPLSLTGGAFSPSRSSGLSSAAGPAGLPGLLGHGLPLTAHAPGAVGRHAPGATLGMAAPDFGSPDLPGTGSSHTPGVGSMGLPSVGSMPAPRSMAGMAAPGFSGGFGTASAPSGSFGTASAAPTDYGTSFAPLGGGSSAPAPPSLPLGTGSSRFTPGAAPGRHSFTASGAPGLSAGGGFASSPRTPSLPGRSFPSVVAPGGGPRRAPGASWTVASPSAGLPAIGPPNILGRSLPAGRPDGQILSTAGARSAGSTTLDSGLTLPRPTPGAPPVSPSLLAPTLTSPALSTPATPLLSSFAPPRMRSWAAAPRLGTLARSTPLGATLSALPAVSPMSLPLAPSAPAMPSASHATSLIVERAPSMPLAPPSPLAGRAARPEAAQSMVIQRVERGLSTPAARTGGAAGGAGREGNPGAANAQGSAGEVNLLANEVWSLLKRRISWEADRRGRW